MIPDNVLRTILEKHPQRVSKSFNPLAQLQVAKSKLPKNVGTRPVNVNVARITRRVPAHLPNGRYTSGWNTVHSWMAANPEREKEILNYVLEVMKSDQNKLPIKVKSLLTKKR
jgi:hypothetical protein